MLLFQVMTFTELTLSTVFAELCKPDVLDVDIGSFEDVLLVRCLDGKDVVSRADLGSGSDANDAGKIYHMLLLFLVSRVLAVD